MNGDLGAASCFNLSDNKFCENIEKNIFDSFTCKKYGELEIWNNEPIRSRFCVNNASNEIWDKIIKNKKKY